VSFTIKERGHVANATTTKLQVYSSGVPNLYSLHAFHRSKGAVFGPFNGCCCCCTFLVLVWCLLFRFSTAANRSSRCRSRPDSVNPGSTRRGGSFVSRSLPCCFDFSGGGGSGGVRGSLADPKRCPFSKIHPWLFGRIIIIV